MESVLARWMIYKIGAKVALYSTPYPLPPPSLVSLNFTTKASIFRTLGEPPLLLTVKFKAMRIATDTRLALSTWNRSALAPRHHIFSKIPDEIFYEIFRRSTHSPNAPAVQPIILSQVSRAWRALAWSAPELWNQILIVEDLEPDTVELDKTLQRIPHFLKLSNACPLKISICVFSYERHLGADAPDDPYCANLDRFRERLRLLSALIAPDLARIKALDITCDEFDVIVDLFSGFPAYTPMPLLEVLAICNTYEDETLSEDMDYPEDAQALTILLRPHNGVLAETAAPVLYPKLSSVMLHAVPLDWGRFCPRDLEVLTLGYLARNVRPKDAVLRRILSESHNTLMSLSLAGCLVGDSWSEEGGEVVAWDPLPELDHLAVGFTHPKEVIPFLSALQVPEIKAFELKNIAAELTAVAERAQLPYHEESTTLIRTVNWNIPLHRLDVLTLEHIAFCPPRDDISLGGVQLIHNWNAQPIPKHAYRFFCSLTSLRTLVLHDADAVTLNAVNYLVPKSTKDPHYLRVPVPALHSLEVSGTAYTLLHSFFEARRKSGSHSALGLTLGIPRSWEPLLKLDDVPSIYVQDLILCDDIFDTRSSTV